MASSSSSSSASTSQWKYVVFLSFRGEDTRKTFTSYLFEGLKKRGIFTFQDNERLDYGDSIPEELMKAIEDSKAALIVFSKNYATSTWCLNELVRIMKSKDKNGQTVIPIFYDVDPSHVRNQTESFAKAFSEHELKCKGDGDEGMQKVQGWRNALTAAANLKGFDIRDGIEFANIQQIVDHISKLCKSAYFLYSSQDVVGVDTHLEKVESLLKKDIDDVRIIGIWGMGGIGKTTIATTIFHKYNLSGQFEAGCILDDVKENAKKNGLRCLQNILLSELLREKDNYITSKQVGKCMIPSRLCSIKVLIVLDDIDHSDHLEYLAGNVSWFGNGSRVIVTTRNKDLIKINDYAIYEVKLLPDDEAMQLFNLHAFRKEVPSECFMKLSLEVVNHAKGLPLALKVWGSLLHNKGLSRWERIVGKIKKTSSLDIVEKLKISYDGLEPEEQEIFLDIACFFRGDKRKEVIQILESCNFEVEYGLDVLIDKSLLFLTGNDRVEMHDLIQDMGKYIVKMSKHPGERSRLWDAEDFKQVMADNTGTMAVEAIWFSCFEQQCFSKEAMKNMRRLRILYICMNQFSSVDSEDIPHGSNCHDGSIEYLPNNLRWFVWTHYPWESLPENFEPRKLVHLELSHSKLRHLWKGTKVFLQSLGTLDLMCSKRLIQTPDFTGMPNLKYLNLEYCTSLEEVHHSLKCCGKLIRLNLDGCESLVRFSYVNVESLGFLHLEYCSSLEKFPEILGRMKLELEIRVEGSGIKELPPSIFQHQAHLTELDLKKYLEDLDNIVCLPRSICMLKGLVKLDVSYCSKLESLPVEIGDFENLEELHAKWTLISQPPSSIVRLNKLKFLTFEKEESEDGVCFVFPQVNEGLRSLEFLNLGYCNLIDRGLPEDIGCLSSLKELYLWGNNFEHLPRSISQLGTLQSLDLSDCKRLKELPGFMGMQYLEYLNLNYCNLIDGGLPKDIGCLSSLEVLNLKGNNFEHLPRSIAQLGTLQFLDLSDCKRLTQLPEFPEQLNRIEADWSNDWICNSLFQNISSLQHDISASDSLSLRVFTSGYNIPSWFHHRGTGTSVSVNLLENWYVNDKFLGFAVCYSGKLIDTSAHLIPLSDDGMSSMTQKLALYNYSKIFPEYDIHFFLVPFAGLWDTSKANGKTPNDYGHIRLRFSEELTEFGLRLLYKDDPELDASCFSSKKHSNIRGKVASLFRNFAALSCKPRNLA